jgi:peptidoglycan/LPS O-acetylase OafA/YrhL
MVNYRVVAAIPLAYALIVSGALLKHRRLRLRTDLSYGVYIYAWPVQQAAVTIFSIASPYVLLAVALPATLGVAFVSWHLIEAPALRLKRRIGPIPTRSHIPVPAASK